MTQDLGLLLLRLGMGGLLLTHGWPKVQKVLNGDFQFADPLGLGAAPSLVLAASAEFLFATLVILGVKVRWTAIPPAITMAVAVFIAHAGDPIGKREKALLFLVGFVAVALLGSGRYALDSLLPRRGGSKR